MKNQNFFATEPQFQYIFKIKMNSYSAKRHQR